MSWSAPADSVERTGELTAPKDLQIVAAIGRVRPPVTTLSAFVRFGLRPCHRAQTIARLRDTSHFRAILLVDLIMLSFFKTTVLGGIVFLVPIVIFIAIVDKALQLTGKLAQPVAAALPVDTFGGVAIAELVALAIVVVVCFLAGLAARSPAAKRAVNSLEANVLDHVPAYALMKAKAGSVLTPDDTRDLAPVLVRFDDSWQLGFEVESLDGEKCLVYLPGAPDPWSGSVCAVARDRVTPLDVTIKDASNLMKRLGKGATQSLKELLKQSEESGAASSHP